MAPRRLLISEETIPTFISEIKKRECIWNPEHENFNDRYEAMNAWKEIAQVMDQPEDVLKSKWKNLRDLFKREIKKYRKIDSIQKYKGRWRYFKAMWFMHKPGDAGNNVDINNLLDDSSGPTFLDDDDEEDEENPLKDVVKCEQLENNEEEEVYIEESEQRVPNKKRKRQEDNDFDMMFLKSLTPYFRQLEPMRKLIVRSKMQDILINEIAAQKSQALKNINRNNNT